MKLAQAKKIAAASGLECEWQAIGQVWRAYNRETGKHFPFTTKSLASYGDRDFANKVARIASAAA